MLRLRKKRVLVAAGLLIACGALCRPAARHYRATQLLLSMQNEERSVPPVPGHPVARLTLPDGTVIPAKEYGPSPERAHLSIILAHGIHHLGIDEPRLGRFAHHLADLGYHVLTPELADLADYQITSRGVEVLKRSVVHLSERSGRVGLIGFSFAGGLSLLSATDPNIARRLTYVASIGGPIDLARTLSFLATDRVTTPRGTETRMAHEYGLLVLLYSNTDTLNLGADENTFKEVLGSWLREDRSQASELGSKLTTKRGRDLFAEIKKSRLESFAEAAKKILKRDRNRLKELSPSGKLGSIRAKVILLHGSEDRVVPPEETLFGAAELGASHSNSHTLVTPLLKHVRVDHQAGWDETWDLVHVMAGLM